MNFFFFMDKSLNIREYYHNIASNRVEAGINLSPAQGRQVASPLRNKGARARHQRGRRGTRTTHEKEEDIARKIALDVVETGEAVKQTVGRRASFSASNSVLSPLRRFFAVYFRSACHLSALSTRSSDVGS